jgi:MFS family permease
METPALSIRLSDAVRLAGMSDVRASSVDSAHPEQRWLTPGVAGIGTASLLADVGHEVPTALLPSLLTSTLGAPAAALGLIEGVSDALAGAARFGGGALADDPSRRRKIAVGGYTSTAVLAASTGLATSVWQVGVLRAGAWAARGLRVPARNALLADVVPASAYGRAYGFERMMDNLGAIFGLLLALGLVASLGVRWAIGLSAVYTAYNVAATLASRGYSRAHRPAGLGIRIARHDPSRWEPGCQRDCRSAVDRRLRAGRVHLPCRVDAPRARRVRCHCAALIRQSVWAAAEGGTGRL